MTWPPAVAGAWLRVWWLVVCGTAAGYARAPRFVEYDFLEAS